MSGLLEAIGGHATVIYGLCGPIGVAAAGYLIWRLLSPAEDAALEPMPAKAGPAHVPAPKPAANPGQVQHQKLGTAKTAVLTPAGPVVKPPPAPAPPEDPTKKKVDRLSEIGFHHTVERTDTPRPLPAQLAPTAIVTAPSAGSSSGTAPVATAGSSSGTAPVVSGEPAPGSRPDLNDTPELDDILSRIDKVLSENPLMATSTIAGNQPPPTDRIDTARQSGPTPAVAPTDKDTGPETGEQQRLF